MVNSLGIKTISEDPLAIGLPAKVLPVIKNCELNYPVRSFDKVTPMARPGAAFAVTVRFPPK
jgi:hypothetical protein